MEFVSLGAVIRGIADKASNVSDIERLNNILSGTSIDDDLDFSRAAVILRGAILQGKAIPQLMEFDGRSRFHVRNDSVMSEAMGLLDIAVADKHRDQMLRFIQVGFDKQRLVEFLDGHKINHSLS